MASSSVTNISRGAFSINLRRTLMSSTQSPSRCNIKSDNNVSLESPNLGGRRRSFTNFYQSQSSCSQTRKNLWDESNLQRQSSLTSLITHSPKTLDLCPETSHPGVVLRKKLTGKVPDSMDAHRRYSWSSSILDHINREEENIVGSVENLRLSRHVDHKSSGQSCARKRNSAKIRHSSYIPTTSFLSMSSQMSFCPRSCEQRRQYNSMENLKLENPSDNESSNSEFGTAIGAAATGTAVAIALLIRNPPTLKASGNGDDETEEELGELVSKCQITKETNNEKIYQGKGPFILQDLYTNTLYLIPQDNKTSTQEEKKDNDNFPFIENEPLCPDDNNNNTSMREQDIPNLNGSDEQQVEESDEVKLIQADKNLGIDEESEPEISVEIVSQEESKSKQQSKYFKLVRRGSGRTLNASSVKYLSVDDQNTSGLRLTNNEENSEDKMLKNVEMEDNDASDNENIEKKNNGKKKERIGFRDRKIIDYENRIRAYSTPDKIFRYFATYKSTIDSEIYMTPEDFLRSLTPGVKQPDGLGLDHFLKFDPETMSVKNLSQNLPEDSIFYKLGKSGLISFSDYVFMLTILSTSRRQFEIAFRMFDLNGDGDVDAEEFEQVENIIRQTTSMGNRHRDHSTTGNTLKGINSALAVYFFGEKLDGKLTIDRFLEFQQELQTAILSLEFQRKDPDEEGKITEKHFAELILTYADYSSKKSSATLKRVKKSYKDKKSNGKEAKEATEAHPKLGIVLDDYIKIFSVLIHIDDVDKALSFYNLAGASIDKTTLKHVAKACAGVELRDHLVDVLFTIFDEDGDGVLSNKEFVSVMKNKLKRGLEKPKDIGVVNLFSAIAKCAKTTPIPAAPTLVFTPH